MTDNTRPSDEDLSARVRALTRTLPADAELRRVLLNMEDPANDEPSRDRYIALVAAGAVEAGLKVALARRPEIDATTRRFEKASFDDRIEYARRLGLLTPEEATEIDRIRDIRNAFAHALTSISFDTPEIANLTKRLYHHPVTDWAGYFAPVFPARRHFAIVCGEFYRNLVREEPVAPRGVKESVERSARNRPPSSVA